MMDQPRIATSIGRLFEFSESPYRFIVRLVSSEIDESVPVTEDMGRYIKVNFEVVDPRGSGLKVGEHFTVGQREIGPTYCWHARELDNQ